MRIVIQRVSQASVAIQEAVVSSIQQGYLVLVGLSHTDTEREVEYLAQKTAGLRLFDDAGGKMNLGLREIGGSVLAVSQFTLYADARKGRRPSFTAAAAPERAQPLYDCFCRRLEEEGIPVEKGVFQATMQISLINDGPVTVILDTEELMNR